MSVLRRCLPYVAALVAAGAVYLAAFEGYDHFSRSIDFNRGPFEDFTGPYYRMGQRVFEDPRPAPGFLYSPAFAIAMGLLVEAQGRASVWTWLALEVASSLLVVLLPLALVRLPAAGWRALYLAVALLSFPLVHNFHWGQVSVAIVALLLAAILALDRGRPLVAGALFGAAVATKFHPLVFLAALAVQRHWRALRWSARWIVLLLAGVPLVVLGWPATLEFYRRIADALAHASATPELWGEAPGKQTFADVAGRWIGGGIGGGIEAEAWKPALRWVGIAWTAAHLFWLRFLQDQGRTESVETFALVFLSTPLWCSPSWPHYFAYLPFCQLVLFARALARAPGARRTVALAAILASVLLASLPVFLWVGDPARYGALGLLFAAHLALLGAFYALFAPGFLAIATRLRPKGGGTRRSTRSSHGMSRS